MKYQVTFWVIGLGILSVIYGCRKDITSNPETPFYDPSPYDVGNVSKFPPLIGVHNDNPLTVEGVKLGRMLFYEKMLSRDGTMSCASCHIQAFAFSDTARVSLGIRGLPGRRQAMSVVNMAWNGNHFFWDGRAELLRDQSLKPIEDHLEMDDTLPNVVSKLGASRMYKDQFIRAFGSEEITPEKMSKAMEQFMNTIISNRSKYDRFLNGELALSPTEERGRILFFKEYNPSLPNESGADCVHCHGGITFENDQYMNNGLDTDAEFKDLGREEITKNPLDRARFKVPTLRNIERTAPYMHDGRFKTLEEVVNHYNLVKRSSTVDPLLDLQIDPGGLFLDAQKKADLVAFLKTLTDYELIQDERFSDPFK